MPYVNISIASGAGTNYSLQGQIIDEATLAALKAVTDKLTADAMAPVPEPAPTLPDEPQPSAIQA